MNRYFLDQQVADSSRHTIKIFLTSDEVLIGRRTMQTNLSSFNQVSRNHALLQISDSGLVFIKDLNSSNGSYVNGNRIGTSLHQLKVGDIIGFGVPSLDGRAGFVCILKREVRVKHEVVTLTDDEDENKAVNTSTGASSHEPLMPICKAESLENNLGLSENGIPSTSRGNALNGPSTSQSSSPIKRSNSECSDEVKDNITRSFENGIPSTSKSNALNGTKTVECPGTSTSQSSFSFKREYFEHSATVKDNITCSFGNGMPSTSKSHAFNGTETVQCPETSTNQPSFSIKKDNFKHSARDNITSSFGNEIPTTSKSNVLNGTKSVECPATSTNQPSSPIKRDNFEHSAGIKNNITSSFALNQIEDSPEISSIKYATDTISLNEGNTSKLAVNVEHNVNNPSISIKTSENAEIEFLGDKLKLVNVKIHLEKCDSENFKLPAGVKSPFETQKEEEEINKRDALLHKTRKRIRKLSFSSDDSNNESIISKNCTRTTNKRRRILDRNVQIYDSSISDDSDQENCLDANVINKSMNKSQILDRNFCNLDNKKPEICYSQYEEIIIISDDESYLDSQNFVPIKEEPLDVQEDIDNVNEDALLREIFDDSEIVSSVSGVQEYNNNVESIEDITAFVSFSDQKKHAEAVKRDTESEIHGLQMECEESASDSKESDSEETTSDEESQLQDLFSAKLPLGDGIDENSSDCNESHTVQNKFNSSTIKEKTLNKSIGRTLLTEPKPLQQRPRKMRGREEGFIEQKKYQSPSVTVSPKQPKKSTSKQPSKLSKSVKTSPKKTPKRTAAAVKLQIGNANSSLKNFKIPRRLEVQNKKNQLNENQLFRGSNDVSSSTTKEGISKTKKVASVKTRPETFGSRSGFLLEKLEIKPLGKGKSAGNKVLLDKRKEIQKNSAEKRNLSNLISVNILKDKPKYAKTNDKSANILKTNKVSVSLNSNRDAFEHSSLQDQSISSTLKIRNQSSNSLIILKDAVKYTKWDDPFISKTFNSSNIASVPSNITTYKDVPGHSRWNQPTNIIPEQSMSKEQPGSSISCIPNITSVPLNTRDPRQVQTKSLPVKDVNKSRQEQTQNISIHSSISPTKTEGFKRPTSSNRAKSYKDFEISNIILAKKLINLKCIWLQEQADFEDIPPPEVHKGAAILPLHFASYDLYASFFYPMMMLEIWDTMYTESKEVFKTNRVANKFYFSVLSYTSKIDCIELKCESIVAEKVSYTPREGSMVMLQMKDGTLKICQPLFGYIFKHSSANLNMDCLKIREWNNLPKEWLANAKHWTFYAYVKKKDMSFALGSLMKGNGICYIRSKLRLADALGQVKNSPLLQSIIKPLTETFSVNYPTSSRASRDYTSCQMKLINGIYSEILINSKTQPKIVLVQGPPGTGKTHTIIGLLEKLVFGSKKFVRILVVAPSNAAVDEIGCRLIDLNERNHGRGNKIIFVRVGSEKQIHKKILPYFLDKKAKELFKQNLTAETKKRDNELQDLEKEISRYTSRRPSHETNERLKYLNSKLKRLKQKYVKKEMDYHTEMSNKGTILKECHVVLSTLNSCGLSILNRTFKPHSNVQFSCCIMDESTQCTEIEVLQPLMFGIDKLVLVGDQEQLPATVTSKLACDYGFRRSMFERFHLFFDKYYHKSPVFTLTEQFRMHSEICKFPSKHFYSGKLITDPGTDLRYNEYPINPYVVLDIMDGQESNDLSSKSNSHEASVIVNLCKSLLNVIDLPSSIGIITPYQGQRSLYERALHQNPNYRAIEINTVDSFQGREKEVIIMSCVRANSQSGGIGFLASKNRLNVAITRAKKCLIICCHASSLKANHDWRTLINDAENRKVLFRVTSPKDIPHLFEKYIKKT